MPNPCSEISVNKEMQTQKISNLGKKKLGLLLLIAIFLFSSIIVPLSNAQVENNSGNETIHVEASSIESITKFLEVGQEIKGKITAGGDDNLITFKLYDPAGNPCMRLNVLRSTNFGWGPVDFEGEYLLVFDNQYPSSDSNDVSLEFQIVTASDNSFQNTLIIVIVAAAAAVVLVVILVVVRRAHSDG
jgi:hypothetical protein